MTGAVTCPCCGQPVAADPLAEARASLSKLERSIFDVVVRRPGLPSVEIADRIYADHPDGGPETADRCVIATVRRMNLKLRPRGMELRCGMGQRTGYRLERLS